MNKYFYSLLILLLISTSSTAQRVIQWQRSYGGTLEETCSDLKPTSDGGCILVGTSYSYDGDVTGNHGNGDGWIVKIDQYGNIEWERTLGGSNYDFILSVDLTSDGGYILSAGTTSNDGDVSAYQGLFSSDLWVVKLDSSGNIEWDKCYGGTGDEYPRTVERSSDGGYILSATTRSSDGDVSGYHPGSEPWNPSADIWLIKIDSIGTLLWQRCLGGSDNENVSAVKQISDNGLVIGGETWGSYDGDLIGNTDTASSGGGSVWIVKLDSARNILWQKTYGGSELELGSDLLICSDESYTFITTSFSEDGDVTNSPGGPSFWLVNIDSSGTIQWEKSYGGDSCLITGAELTRTIDGGYAFTGQLAGSDSDFPTYHYDPLNSISGDIVVIETDSIGNTIYQHCYGGFSSEGGAAIAFASDLSLFAGGGSSSNDGDVSGHHGPIHTSDIWLLKFDSQLTLKTSTSAKPINIFKVYPNPVSSFVKISFYLPHEELVSVKVYDISGKEIKTLLYDRSLSGYQELHWSCNDDNQQEVLNGIYIVRIVAGNYTDNFKVTIIR